MFDIQYNVRDGLALIHNFFQIFQVLVDTAVQYFGPLAQKWQGRFISGVYGYKELGKDPHKMERAWWYAKEQPFYESIEERLGEHAKHLDAGQVRNLSRLLCDMTVFCLSQRAAYCAGRSTTASARPGCGGIGIRIYASKKKNLLDKALGRFIANSKAYIVVTS